jgi:hypothetical protein
LCLELIDTKVHAPYTTAVSAQVTQGFTTRSVRLGPRRPVHYTICPFKRAAIRVCAGHAGLAAKCPTALLLLDYTGSSSSLHRLFFFFTKQVLLYYTFSSRLYSLQLFFFLTIQLIRRPCLRRSRRARSEMSCSKAGQPRHGSAISLNRSPLPTQLTT